MTKWILMAVIVVVVLSILGLCGQRVLRVDRCLDAGGRWNYDVGKCEGADW